MGKTPFFKCVFDRQNISVTPSCQEKIPQGKHFQNRDGLKAVGQADEEVIRRRAGRGISVFSSLKKGGKSAG